MNRGRHKTKKYPKECYNLEYFNTFKRTFTPKEAELLIQRIKEYSSNYGYNSLSGTVNLQGWERYPTSSAVSTGFDWAASKEGHLYWNQKISKFITLKSMKNERSQISNQKQSSRIMGESITKASYASEIC